MDRTSLMASWPHPRFLRRNRLFSGLVVATQRQLCWPLMTKRLAELSCSSGDAFALLFLRLIKRPNDSCVARAFSAINAQFISRTLNRPPAWRSSEHAVCHQEGPPRRRGRRNLIRNAIFVAAVTKPVAPPADVCKRLLARRLRSPNVHRSLAKNIETGVYLAR